jgi:O-acetyl-ADP-ribose deacetylase (regulator of RNase III)
MPARYAIHAATMEPGGPTATATALVAFGTGVGRFPSEDAGRLMADVVRQHRAGSVEKVVCSPLQATQPNRALEASLESSARG